MADKESKTSKFVGLLQKGKNADAGQAFKDALRDKVASALDKARVAIAGKIFNGTQAEKHSDPKPAVTAASDKTDKIMDTDGKEIQFTPSAEAPTADAPEAK